MSIFAHNKQASKHEVRKNFLSKNCLWDLSEIISEPFIENLTVKWHSQLERKKFYLIQNILSKKSSNNNFTLNPSKSLSRRHLISSSFNLSLSCSHTDLGTQQCEQICAHIECFECFSSLSVTLLFQAIRCEQHRRCLSHCLHLHFLSWCTVSVRRCWK